MYFFGEKLENEGYKIAHFFIQSSECTIKSFFNLHTYRYFKKKLAKDKLFSVKDITLEFIKNYKFCNPDLEYLKKIEELYGTKKNLNQQLVSSQLTSTPFHGRFFWKDLTYNQSLYWLELNYKKCLSVINEFDPKIIFDLDTAEISRTILNEICQVHNIKYINVEYPRYQNWILPTFNLGLENETFFTEAYKSITTRDIDAEKREVIKFRESKKIMAERFSKDDTSRYNYSFLEAIIKMLKITYATFYSTLSNISLLRYKINIPLFTNPIVALFWHAQVVLRKLLIYKKVINFFSPPNQNDEYVYMPLHVIPESTTFVKSPMHVDELSIIHAASKSLPVGWILYVKEHQAMIGERPLSFYRAVNRLFNVKLVQFDFYDDPKPWISNSKGVLTISGSSAFEARMLGKPAAVFAHVAYNVIPGIARIKSYHELSEVFRNFELHISNEQDIIDCAKYLKVLKIVGTELDVKELIRLSCKEITGLSSSSEKDELSRNIDYLFLFFKRSKVFH